MKRILPILLLIISAAGFAQRNEPAIVRVRLFSQEQPSTVRVTTADRVVTINARELKTTFRSQGPVTIQRGALPAVSVTYPLEISERKGTLLIVTQMPMEDYVAAVLGGESAGFRSDESMKAMAVAARTYAVHFMHRHGSEGFDFCDSTHCQDLRLTAMTNQLRKAVDSTNNEVLHYEGKPIAAYYHQSCGGVTEGRGPYLIQMKDSFCVSKGGQTWASEVSAAALEAALGLRQINNIEVVERTGSGRAQRVRVTATPLRLIDAEQFRLTVGRTLGWDKIRSDLYDVHRSGDTFTFEGRGAGHGIGLCQAGAAVMGEQGRSYKEILSYYFPGTTIARTR